MGGSSRHSLRPLQHSFPSRQPKPKHRFSAVFGCFRPKYLLILPKYPLNLPWIPDNQASGRFLGGSGRT
ncbi:hypothetical protein BVD88_01605 [Neisseria meningitidis]|nr:hypothetical protein BVD88_01605 [Neisseria meningitidis]